MRDFGIITKFIFDRWTISQLVVFNFIVILLLSFQGYSITYLWTAAKLAIDTQINMSVLLYAAYTDDDGDLDLASAGEGDDDVIWYENRGGTPISWIKRSLIVTQMV